MAPVKEWDATGYQRVSVPHEEWAAALMERLPLAGGETVLDAGCGTGRVTRMLVERLPTGKVVAVDGSAAMVEKVGEVLRPTDSSFVADLTALELDEPVDAIVSSAVFHWIADHDALFARMRAALREGGRIEAQCGGKGNIDEFRRVSGEVVAREPYAAHLDAAGFEEPWFYADAEETEERLRAAGFTDVKAWLQPWDVVPSDPREFMRTLILKPQVDSLPAELHGRLLDDVEAAVGAPFTLRYVRLNISALAA
ncbi:MAG TPA: methyltransferase domain-containing protein [Solirubrobacterales bacterium]|nr:methyltransferase domain-containing protein [Solirubrobacterales bacterium]